MIKIISKKKKGLKYKGKNYKVNPFAICNDTAPESEVGKKKHERCVKKVKEKSEE